MSLILAPARPMTLPTCSFGRIKSTAVCCISLQQLSTSVANIFQPKHLSVFSVNRFIRLECYLCYNSLEHNQLFTLNFDVSASIIAFHRPSSEETNRSKVNVHLGGRDINRLLIHWSPYNNNKPTNNYNNNSSDSVGSMRHRSLLLD